MRKIAIVGLDIAKEVFQVHTADQNGVTISRRRLARKEVEPYFRRLAPCLVGIEACATSHHWGRRLTSLGHRVKLMSPGFVKPYVKSQKNDAADAEAICEAVSRPTMRFVAIKSHQQQAVIALHTARELLMHQQTAIKNAIRGCCSEFGIVEKTGQIGFSALVEKFKRTPEATLPAAACAALAALLQQFQSARDQIRTLEAQMRTCYRADQNSRRLATIPGIGYRTATALAATIGDPHQFKSGRCLSAWMGLVPRQYSSGGKIRLGPIPKRGKSGLRTMLILSARHVLWRLRRSAASPFAGLRELLNRKPFWLVAVALANRMARVAWALLTRQENFKPAAPAA
jgi:transposase